MAKSILILIAISSSIFFVDATIPPYLKVCKATDPKLAACIIDSMEKLRPYLGNGIPEMGVPALEPFPLEKVHQPSLNLTMTDPKIFGLTSYEIKELTADLHKYQIAMVAAFTNITLKSKYSIATKLVSIPLKGEGELVATIGSIPFVGKLKGKRKTIDGKVFVDLKFLEFKIGKPIGVTLKLDGLFPDNEQLQKAGGIVVDENAHVLVEDVIKVIEPMLKEEVNSVANHITNTYPEEEIFPQD